MLNKTSPANSPIVAPPVVTSVSRSWVEGPCLLETEAACCHKYSCTRKERTCPEFFQANYLENELTQKSSCARTGMCQWFLLCRAEVLERRLPCGTQSCPPSAPIDSTTESLKGFCITGWQDFPFAGHRVCTRKTCMSDWEEKNICTSYTGEIVQEQLILVKILLQNAAKTSGYVAICHVNASLWATASCHIACNLGIWQN